MSIEAGIWDQAPFDSEDDIDVDEKDQRRQEYARKHSRENVRENEGDLIHIPKGKPLVEDDWEAEAETWDDEFDDMPPNIWDDLGDGQSDNFVSEHFIEDD